MPKFCGVTTDLSGRVGDAACGEFPDKGRAAVWHGNPCAFNIRETCTAVVNMATGKITKGYCCTSKASVGVRSRVTIRGGRVTRLGVKRRKR